jgi:multiple sugar transport system permease protein
MRRKHEGWIRGLVLVGLVLIALLPLLWTLLASFSIQPDNSGSPPVWTLPASFENYQEIRAEQTFFWQELITNWLISAATTLLTVTVGFCAAYSLAHARFKHRKLLTQSLLILASLPAIAYVIPLQDVTRRLHLYDTFIGVVLAQAALYAPFAVYILHGYVRQMQPELEEEAVLNGATLTPLLWQVVLPTLAPAVIATAVIVFVLSWNQFFLPLILTNTNIRALPVMMRDFFALERDFEWSKAAAVIMISVLPVGVFVAFAHRILEGFSLMPHLDS